MTAIRASFSDFRTVKSRKVAQLVMEVPIEEADTALRALGGVPQPHADRWVGIAPLTTEAATQRPEREQISWDVMPYPQQAGIRCNEPEFQTWLGCSDAEESAQHVRDFCKIDSRAELNTSKEAAALWRQMDADFKARNIGG